jgi:CRISPR-associated protein Cas1
VVHFADGQQPELHVPLRRLASVCIAKDGVSISAAVIQALAARGVKLFFLDFRGVPVACLSGTHQHAVVKVRKTQLAVVDSAHAWRYARAILYGKIRNQRAVLLYFSKYAELGNVALLRAAAEELKARAETLGTQDLSDQPNWRNRLFGIEGEAADIYWRAVADDAGISLFPRRVGRGATDVANAMLNYAYGILATYIWSAVIHAGLEPYAGFLHVERPGKPSLVLDLIEEYRAWVVDRLIMKQLRLKNPPTQLDTSVKRTLVEGVRTTMLSDYPYKEKRYRLDSILQHQVYRLVGAMVDAHHKYKPYLFKW